MCSPEFTGLGKGNAWCLVHGWADGPVQTLLGPGWPASSYRGAGRGADSGGTGPGAGAPVPRGGAPCRRLAHGNGSLWSLLPFSKSVISRRDWAHSPRKRERPAGTALRTVSFPGRVGEARPRSRSRSRSWRERRRERAWGGRRGWRRKQWRLRRLRFKAGAALPSARRSVPSQTAGRLRGQGFEPGPG